MRNFLSDTLAFLTGLLSYIVPKKKRLYVYIPAHDPRKFASNTKALFIYSNENHKEIKNVYIARNHKVYNEIKSQGYLAVNNPILAIWNVLRAEHIIIDATLKRLSDGNFSIIQLWHGTGFKDIGLLNNNNDSKLNRIKKHYKKYRIIVANSNDDLKRKNDSFDSENAMITGSPRNDLFFSNRTFTDLLKRKYDVNGFDKIISYTPTFRDFNTTEPFSESFWNRLNDYLIRSNSVFLIKKHPWDKYLKVPANFSNIKDFSTLVSDVQELLLISDVLISDYSGIITDFAITGKPIIIYNYDYDQYMETCRTMYYDLNEIFPKPFVKDEEDLLNKISDQDWTNTPLAQESYQNFKNKFHTYNDGNSSKRVMEAILKL